ncbi:MAG: MBOAT family O-acyltransferase [Bacteroidota bacterium]
MLFNSVDFAVFFPLVFILYWTVLRSNLRAQNIFLLAASYLFYGWWDWRFLLLIAFSSVVDFYVGQSIARATKPQNRKWLLALSLGLNLGLLGFFKYYHFFVDNFVQAFSLFGRSLEPTSLNIILPVGISFYTFQTLSYSIDVYRKRIEPATNLLNFLAFVSFFPQLVAGPIERAKHLLPQFSRLRRFNYAASVDGLRQILFGLFKKVVIADNCAVLVNEIFANSGDYSGGVLVLGAILFAFQIYGDFSGYSDIAIGLARMLGFDLMRNFAYPYFSRDIAEFWRRWHISLSSWFKDYLYIPLGGSKGGKWLNIRNVFIIFLVSGFWHGANWTFVAWGGLNALLFLPLLLSNRNRKNLAVAAGAPGQWFPDWREFLSILLTFLLVCFTWIFFRADSITAATHYVERIFVTPFFATNPLAISQTQNFLFLPMIGLLLGLEWVARRDQHALQTLGLSWPRSLRWVMYLGLSLTLLIFSGSDQEFIYFQF